MISIPLLQEIVGVDGVVGLAAGGLLAMVIHQTRGLAQALGLILITLLAIALIQGGPDLVHAWMRASLEYSVANAGLARGAAIGAASYTLFALGFALGQNAAIKTMQRD